MQHDDAQDVCRLGSQRQSDSDLRGSLADDELHDAEDADGGHDEGEGAEGADEHEDEAPLRDGFRADLRHRPDVVSGNVLVHGAQRRAHFRNQDRRVGGRAQHDERIHRRILQVVDVGLG